MQNQPVIPNDKFECPIQVVHVIYAELVVFSIKLKRDKEVYVKA